MQEIIVDNFAGGGGASTGIELATGRSVDIAINHDPAAIAMHRSNHPETEHYCESVWDIDPKKVVRGRSVGLVWLSPDCKHFSKAKGSKPVEKRIRGLAWVAIRWAATVRPRVIMLENVEEFKTWGPLTKDGYPDLNRKGHTFNSFINALKRQGYKVEYRELRACDFGAPTTRKRLFLIARCDGKPIIWPEATHGKPGTLAVLAGIKKPYRTAAEIIDWSIPCPSIFERKKPLADNTQRRIVRGIQRFIIEHPNPFLMNITEKGIISSHITHISQIAKDRLQSKVTDSVHTRTTDAEHRLLTPILGVNTTGHPGSSPEDPLKTVTTGGHHMLITPVLAQYHTDKKSQSVEQATFMLHEKEVMIPTIKVERSYIREVRAFLLKYYGNEENGQVLNDPLHTITTKDRFGLVTVQSVDYQIIDIGVRMLQPHELFAAQGFPKTYTFNVDVNGKRYPKSVQVARCGNAVPPPFSEALVRVNLPELCVGSGNKLTIERYQEAVGQVEFSL